MASYLLRRSGIAVGLVAEVLGWRADLVIQVGVGNRHQEVDVLSSEWPGVRFVGYEPHPGIIKGLRDEYPGEIHQLAMSDFNGPGVLFAKKCHGDGSSLVPTSDPNILTFEVRVRTLDSMFCEEEIRAMLNERILLWVDCEGRELEALKGGEKILRLVDVVNVEMTSHPPEPGWSKTTDIHSYLVEQGFMAQWVHTQRIGAGQTDFVYVRPQLFKPDYCCFPWEVERFNEMRRT
ncbi:MAG: FkbM family methyltransferase [Bacteroidales bacterium]|jgi:FkbM family methyltransferase